MYVILYENFSWLSNERIADGLRGKLFLIFLPATTENKLYGTVLQKFTLGFAIIGLIYTTKFVRNRVLYCKTFFSIYINTIVNDTSLLLLSKNNIICIDWCYYLNTTAFTNPTVLQCVTSPPIGHVPGCTITM